jgi:hypothetical protein
MPWLDWYTLVGMGGFFMLLGIVGFFWGRYEERTYYDAIANRPDVREFLDHLPWRPEPHAIIIGARIAITVGIFLIVFGGAYWLWWT